LNESRVNIILITMIDIIGDEKGYVVYGTKYQTFEIFNKNFRLCLFAGK